MKKYLLLLLLMVSQVTGAITDIWIPQRDTATTFANIVITGSSNTNELLGFNSSGTLVSLSDINPVSIGLTTRGSGAFTTLSASGAALFADGTVAAPSIGWTSDADGSGTGFYRNAGNRIAAVSNGTTIHQTTTTALDLSSSVKLSWNGEVELNRLAAASLRLGAAASATPLANTLTIGESSRSGTDSNVAGANGTIASGTGTGTGAVSSIIFQTPTVAGAGTGAQALATRLTLSSAGVAAEATGKFFFTGRASITSPGDRKIKLGNTSAVDGVTLDLSTDGTLKVRNFADSADGPLTAGAGTFGGVVIGTRFAASSTGSAGGPLFGLGSSGMYMTASGGDVFIGANATQAIQVSATNLSTTFSGPVTLKGYTVATLPAGTVGMTAYVTDATAPTYLGALIGGGAVTCPVFYNGTAWVSN